MGNLRELKQLLTEKNNIVITSHVGPDGDALGSSLGLYHILKSLNKNVSVILPDNFPYYLSWLPEAEKIVIYTKHPQEAERLLKESEVIFYLDYNSYKRAGSFGKHLQEENELKKTILIDHHQDTEIVADYSFVDTLASSTSEIVYKILDLLNLTKELEYNTAVCLYVGIVSDTQYFKVSNVSSETHQIASKLISYGLDSNFIQNQLLSNTSIDRLFFIGFILSEKLIVFRESNAAYILITLEEQEQYNYRIGDLEGVANIPLQTKDIEFSCLITEKKDQVNLSFRSKGNLKVNKIAKEHFNGGGHFNAAGAKSNLPINEVERKVVDIIKKMIIGS